MPAAPPQDSTIAVVGDGFGSLLVHATARYLGFAPEQIRIYGTSTTAVGARRHISSVGRSRHDDFIVALMMTFILFSFRPIV